MLMLALWSLLRWERKVGLVALEHIGPNVDSLAADVDRTLRSTCEEVRQQLGPLEIASLPSGERCVVIDDQTPLEALLAASEEESRGLGHSWVGSEHLLLAVIRLAEPPIKDVLDRHGVTYDGVRRTVVDLLQFGS